MKIVDFLKENPVNQQENEICKKIYGNLDLTEKEWRNKLQGSVTFLVKKEIVIIEEESKVDIFDNEIQNETSDKNEETIVSVKPKKKK